MANSYGEKIFVLSHGAVLSNRNEERQCLTAPWGSAMSMSCPRNQRVM